MEGRQFGKHLFYEITRDGFCTSLYFPGKPVTDLHFRCALLSFYIKWYVYNFHALRYFDSKKRIGKDLLIFDIENDDPSKIGEFLEPLKEKLRVEKWDSEAFGHGHDTHLRKKEETFWSFFRNIWGRFRQFVSKNTSFGKKYELCIEFNQLYGKD